MMKRVAGLLMCVMLSASPGIKGQSESVAPGDWTTFNRTLAGDRFSPLSEINRENVTRLRPLCTYTLPEVVALETGPLVVEGTMYFTSDLGSYAIDADTCAEKWRRVREVAKPNGYGAHRGFAYLDGMLFRGTSDAHAIALDAKDGRTKWDVTLDTSRRLLYVPAGNPAPDFDLAMRPGKNLYASATKNKGVTVYLDSLAELEQGAASMAKFGRWF